MAEQKSPTRVAAGLKAAVHNPRVSEEAKESATERLQSMDENPETSSSDHREDQQKETIDGKSAGNVLRGYKATLNNPRVSEEAKQKAEQILEEHNA